MLAFTDPMTDCRACKKRFRADHLIEEMELEESGGADEEFVKKLNKLIKKVKCPSCGGELTEARRFNLMVDVGLGVVEGEKKKTYLRGEACQTIYLNYQNVLNSFSPKIPFGIEHDHETFYSLTIASVFELCQIGLIVRFIIEKGINILHRINPKLVPGHNGEIQRIT